MGFFDRFQRKSEELSFDQLLIRMAGLNQVGSAMSVTPQNAMRCTTIHGIVRAISNSIGSLPPRVVRRQSGPAGNYFTEQMDHPINALLRRPNAVNSPTEFYRMMAKHLLLHGNFYALKAQGQTGPIAALRPIEKPEMVDLSQQPVNWRGTGATFDVRFDGQTDIVPQSRLLRITSGLIADDGVTGISPVELCKEAIGICLAAELLVAQLYGNNDVPTMALIGGTFGSAEQYQLWQQKFKEASGSTSGGRGGTLLLPNGMEVKNLSFSPVDSQLLEMRKFQRLEIAQVYGVPPHKLADLERATFSNIEEQSLEFIRDTIGPWARLIEQSMNRDLLTQDDRDDGLEIRFDMTAATEGKFTDRVAGYKSLVEMSALNPNEVRQRIGENPRTDDAGDDYVVPLNMRSSNESTDTQDEPDRSEDAADESQQS